MRLHSRRMSWLFIPVLLAFLAGCAVHPSMQETPPATPAGSEIIAATYNIHHGVGMDKRRDLGRIARVLTGQKVDVAGLQEIDRRVLRTNRADEFQQLKFLTGMSGVFGKSIEFQGGDYGIMILTTGKILETRHELFPVGAEKERRSYLLVRIRFPNGLVAWVADTHLGLSSADRQKQAEVLLESTAHLDAPVILLGDFNATPDAGEPPIHKVLSRSFLDAWSAAPTGSLIPVDVVPYKEVSSYDGATFPSDGPKKRIDYIWLRPRDAWTVERCWVGGTLGSDHLPLFARLKTTGQGE